LTGDKPIFANTTYFFDKTYKNAVCKFERRFENGTKMSVIVQVLRYD